MMTEGSCETTVSYDQESAIVHQPTCSNHPPRRILHILSLALLRLYRLDFQGDVDAHVVRDQIMMGRAWVSSAPYSGSTVFAIATLRGYTDID